MASDAEVTIQSLPPLKYREYLDLQRKLKLPLKVRIVIGGGGMNPVDLLEDIRNILGVDMILGYGQTEVGGFAAAIRLQDQLERPTSTGPLLPHWTGRIVDGEGRELPMGEAGELLLRGPSATTGYINLPEASRETLAGGWLHTGDIFYQDEDGFLHFVSRKKELVKSAGENVYPAEVELVLNRHPAIADSCVVGVPDKRFGEAVKAFIVLKANAALTPVEAADWCRQSIAGYKRPRFVEFIDTIPRNFQGKPQRTALSQKPVTEDQATDK